ncbi:UDP-glucose 4-epimerase GalE [Prochlorococcus sp. AH-716-N03]|nr:UDP-glucose 4-epimerase GalE [Prochlorococcus sp. AH-716-N03]
MKTILVTGGAGFIGSHTCLELLDSNYTIFIIDSNVNSSKLSIDKLIQIGKNNNLDYKKNIFFFKGDIRDEEFLNNVFQKAKQLDKKIDAVIHFAGLKSVSESVRKPLLYWDVNVNGALKLFSTMQKNNCKTIVFSSSATVYGFRETSLKENFKLKPANPYGETKVAIERILKNLSVSEKDSWRVANLRYFNPIGAHPSGLIGENPSNAPENIFPFICQVALGKKDKLYVFGNDWPTKDGTCLRDYIHIMDLANAHKCSLDFLLNNSPQNIDLNIGTGKGTSVLELINIFCDVNKCKINYEFTKRRNGDVAQIIADTKKVNSILNWRPKKNIADMCLDGFKWQKLNPKGFIDE